jgi:hypothetical protein
LNDLVNTGEIQSLSYAPGPLPAGTVYGRIWVENDSVWRFSDCTFTSSSAGPASFTAPADGAQVSGNPTTFTWTSAPGAQAYYLYVGTTSGAKDVVDTGEIPQTSYSATLPAGRHLFARIWTEFAGRWVYQEIDFTTSPAAPASLIEPADGATINTGTVTFRWTASSGSLAYYLYIGSAIGLKDIVDTGEISTTTLTTPLPDGQQIFVRLWTRFVDHWEYRDSSFNTGTVVSWTWPRDGASNIGSRIALAWTPVRGATYDVTIGTAPGAGDVLQRTGLSSAVLPGTTLPARGDLFGRVVAHVSGQDHVSDIHFTTSGSLQSAWSTFAYPFDGASGVGAAAHIAWTPVDGAISYYLYVGRRPGAKDVIDYGEVQTTSVDATSLPPGPLFGRIWTHFPYGWKYTDIVFSGDTSTSPVMAYPSPANAQSIDLAYPLQWMPMTGAQAYWLQIGTAAGRSDLLDTGAIAVTRRYVPSLPTGQQLYGRIGAMVAGTWKWTDFQFVASGNSGEAYARVSAALALTGEVRAMANGFNQPEDGSKLAEVVAAAGVAVASCTQYADTLIELLAEANLQFSAARDGVCLNTTNEFDCHTLVAVLDPVSGVRLLLDPTMGFSPVHESTGAFLLAEEMASAAASQSFDDVAFQFVTPQTDQWASSYYLDYPLLYLSLATGHSPLEVMDPIGASVEGPPAVYAVQCLSGPATALVDGDWRTLDCRGTDQLTQVFLAGSIQPSDGSSIQIWQPRRYIFR